MPEETHVSRCLQGLFDEHSIDPDEFVEAYVNRGWTDQSQEHLRQIVEGKSREFDSGFPIEAALAMGLSEEGMLRIHRVIFNDIDELISECEALGVLPLDSATQTVHEPRRAG